jgi:hypothetical protein
MYGSTTLHQINLSQCSCLGNKLGSATVYIGIIDEGYMYTHEDLAANAGKTQEK